MNKNKYRGTRTAISVVFFVIIVLMSLFALVSWQGLKVSYYNIESDKLNGNFRIVHLSDLHSTYWGENQEELISEIDELKPDIICLTGDIADDHIAHDGTLKLMQNIGNRYKCYYVTGNHETYVPEGLEVIKRDLFEANGITILDPGWEQAEINGQLINICGFDDIEVLKYDKWIEQLKRCADNKTQGLFSILLSHRPERYEEYSQYDFDLILSGHTHGGQMRIPGILNGIYASNQGLFPEYVGGDYELSNGSTMIVNRGLVKNLIPRTFNPPEIGVIDVKVKLQNREH